MIKAKLVLCSEDNGETWRISRVDYVSSNDGTPFGKTEFLEEAEREAVLAKIEAKIKGKEGVDAL